MADCVCGDENESNLAYIYIYTLSPLLEFLRELTWPSLVECRKADQHNGSIISEREREERESTYIPE